MRAPLALCLVTLWVLLTPLAPARGPATGPRVAQEADITIAPVQGRFFHNSGLYNGVFDVTPTQTPVFIQEFPVINFNPPAGAQLACANKVGIDEFSRPFADVVGDASGHCATIVAQDPMGRHRAGVDDMTSFEVVFTTNLHVSTAGQATFSIFADDGWVLSVGANASGDQPTRVQGVLVNPLGAGAFTGYPVLGASNKDNMPTQSTVTVNFPAPGTYPIEMDYNECCQGQLSLNLELGFTPQAIQPVGAPPTGSATPSPSAPPTPSAVPSAPANLASPTAAPAGDHTPRFPLSVEASPWRVASGHRLTVSVRTLAWAHVAMTLRVVVTRGQVVNKAAHSRRPLRTLRQVVLYQIGASGRADSHGRFSRALRVSYRAARLVVAHLTVTARSGRASGMAAKALAIAPASRR